MRVLVTGATGFVGSTLVRALIRKTGIDVVGVVRSPDATLPKGAATFRVDGLTPEQDWGAVLPGTDAVVHCAARAHVMHEQSADPLAEFRKINVEATLNLARQSAEAGVRRFVFISTIKVNGEKTEAGRPFNADQPPNPVDSYGVSKMEAEAGLQALARGTGMELVIIRPPLIYGPGVKANFLAMMRWLRRGIPLPLGAVTENQRSLVAVDNLVDLIAICLDHPAAANQTFLVSDGEDISTAELLRRLGAVLGRPARLFPVPAGLLRSAAAMLGRQEIAQRLCSSLVVDIGKTRDLLNWSPPVSVDEGLRRAAAQWINSRQ